MEHIRTPADINLKLEKSSEPSSDIDVTAYRTTPDVSLIRNQVSRQCEVLRSNVGL